MWRKKSQSLVLRTSHAAALLQRNGGSPARRPEPVDHPRAEKVSLDPKEAPEGTFPADTMTNNNVRFVQLHTTAHAHHTRHMPPDCQTACANRQQQPTQQHALHRVSCPSRQKHAPSQTTRRCTHCAEQLQRPS